MLREWNFLILEMWVLLAAAAILGVFVGWMIWARKAVALRKELSVVKKSRDSKVERVENLETDIRSLKGRYHEGLARTEQKLEEREAHLIDLEAQLETIEDDHAKDLDALRAAVADRDSRILDLETKLHATPSDVMAEIAELTRNNNEKDRMIRRLQRDMPASIGKNGADPDSVMNDAGSFVSAAPVISPIAEEPAPGLADTPSPFLHHIDDDTAAPATRPEGLVEARNGRADDLTLIKGIGPSLEQLCYSLGFYHFDQIASWTDAEIAWVDDNLEGFKGRVTRDDWVGQAAKLVK